MPSPVILDFDALLAPISEDHPAGESVRYDGTYDAIEEARRSDDDLPQGEWVRDTKTADWLGVIELSTQTLATKSKDLQVAAWLVEALVKRHGFAGLRDGLVLLRQLPERFWDALYPQIEDDDLEGRGAPLVWLNDKLPPSIRQVPVTQGMNGERYAWLHWKESREVDNLGRRDPTAMAAVLAEGKINGEQFDKAVETTPLTSQQTLLDDLNQLWKEYEQVDRLVDERFGRDAPSLLDIKGAIQDCRTLLTDILKKRGGLVPEAELEPPRAEAPSQVATPAAFIPESSTVPTISHTGMVAFEPQSRADALRRLAAIADFFRKTEPHSPVAYLVQRAVRWGEMPLDQWLQDVIHDESVLGQIRETLGLKETGENSGS